MDILDLMVPPEERECLDEDIHPAWIEGMSCPVLACGEQGYQRYPAIRLHWNLVHLPYLTFFCCNLCVFRFPRRNQLKRHYSRTHHLSVEEASSRSVGGKELPNSRFIDPKDKCIPMIKVSEEMALCREEAAARCRVEATTGVLTTRTVTIARDQEVVPLGRGQALIQDQVRWLRTGVARSREIYQPVEIDFSQFDN